MPVLIDGLAHGAFVSHACLLHHPARGGILGEVRGVDAVQGEGFEAETEDGLQRFGGVASPPVGFAYPVADLGLAMPHVGTNLDGSEELLVLLAHDRKGVFCPLLSRLLLMGEPLSGVLFGVGIGDVRDHAVDVAFLQQRHNVGDICFAEGPKDEARGFKGGLTHHVWGWDHFRIIGSQ